MFVKQVYNLRSIAVLNIWMDECMIGIHTFLNKDVWIIRKQMIKYACSIGRGSGIGIPVLMDCTVVGIRGCV